MIPLVSESVTIPGRFNGPLRSGNGGYAAGVVAGFLEGAATVNLRSPVPLDRPLEVARAEDGSVRLLDGEALVAEGRPAPEVGVEPPGQVGVDEASRAAAGYRGPSEGTFSRCFVCGREREDGFGVFAGAVEGRGLVASPWTPPVWAADSAGEVLPEFIWAVLDCPASYASYLEQELGLGVLAEITARIDAPVLAGEQQVVIGWPIGTEGRKRYAGSAVLGADGQPRALARALLIEPRAG